MAANKDPIATYRVGLEVKGLGEAYFREASGFNNTTETIEHREVGQKGVIYIHKLAGATKWDDITLRRGITDDVGLWEWRQKVINGDIAGARSDGSIIFYDAAGTEVSRFNFFRGWPRVWKGADFKADENTVAVEEVQITHEGLVRAGPGALPYK